MIDATRANLLSALAEFSEVAPTMRFGQTIANMANKAKSPGTRTEAGEAVWDIEDAELLAVVVETTSAWKEQLDGASLTDYMPMEQPTGEGRTPENVHGTWSMLIETMLGFAEANASDLRGDRDREVIASLRRSLDRREASIPTSHKSSIAS